MIRYIREPNFETLWYHPNGLSELAVLCTSDSSMTKSLNKMMSDTMNGWMRDRIVPLSSTYSWTYRPANEWVTVYEYNSDIKGRIDVGSGQPLPVVTDAIQNAYRPKNPEFWERSRKGEIVCSNMHANNLLLDSTTSVTQPTSGWSRGSNNWQGMEKLKMLLEACGFPILSNFHKVINFNAEGVAFRTPLGIFVASNVRWSEDFTVNGVSKHENAQTLGFDTQDVLSQLYAHVNDPSVYEFDSELITKSMAEANQGQLDLLTTLGELPETINGIMTQLQRVFNFTKNACDKEKTILRLATNRKRKKHEVGRRAAYLNSKEQRQASQATIDAVAEVWMTWRYEIMPCIYTLVDYGDAIANLNMVYKTTREFNVRQIAVPKVAGWTCSTETQSIKDNVFIKDRYSLETLLGDLSKVLTFNAVITGWELIKRSFVLDWFFNIGEFLASMFGYQHYQQRVASYSFKAEYDLKYIHDETGCEVRIWGRCYKRILIEPGDYLNLSARFDMNLVRYLDSVAMLWPLLKKQWNKLSYDESIRFNRIKVVKGKRYRK